MVHKVGSVRNKIRLVPMGCLFELGEGLFMSGKLLATFVPCSEVFSRQFCVHSQPYRPGPRQTSVPVWETEVFENERISVRCSRT